MVNETQSSFIPKNNLSPRKKVGRRHNLFFVSIVVYGFFITAPIASAVVFIYEKHTSNEVNKTIKELDTAIKTFSESDLLAVTQFSERLSKSNELLNTTVSLEQIFQFFLEISPQTVSYKSITIDTADTESGTVVISAEVASESFDNVLFFRDELLRSARLANAEISDLTYTSASIEQPTIPVTSSGGVDSNEKLSYTVSFTVPILAFSRQITTEQLPAVTEEEAVNLFTTKIIEPLPDVDNSNDF